MQRRHIEKAEIYQRIESAKSAIKAKIKQINAAFLTAFAGSKGNDVAKHVFTALTGNIKGRIKTEYQSTDKINEQFNLLKESKKLKQITRTKMMTDLTDIDDFDIEQFWTDNQLDKKEPLFSALVDVYKELTIQLHLLKQVNPDTASKKVLTPLVGEDIKHYNSEASRIRKNLAQLKEGPFRPEVVPAHERMPFENIIANIQAKGQPALSREIDDSNVLDDKLETFNRQLHNPAISGLDDYRALKQNIRDLKEALAKYERNAAAGLEPHDQDAYGAEWETKQRRDYAQLKEQLASVEKAHKQFQSCHKSQLVKAIRDEARRINSLKIKAQLTEDAFTQLPTAVALNHALAIAKNQLMQITDGDQIRQPIKELKQFAERTFFSKFNEIVSPDDNRIQEEILAAHEAQASAWERLTTALQKATEKAKAQTIDFVGMRDTKWTAVAPEALSLDDGFNAETILPGLDRAAVGQAIALKKAELEQTNQDRKIQFLFTHKKLETEASQTVKRINKKQQELLAGYHFHAVRKYEERATRIKEARLEQLQGLKVEVEDFKCTRLLSNLKARLDQPQPTHSSEDPQQVQQEERRALLAQQYGSNSALQPARPRQPSFWRRNRSKILGFIGGAIIGAAAAVATVMTFGVVGAVLSGVAAIGAIAGIGVAGGAVGGFFGKLLGGAIGRCCSPKRNDWQPAVIDPSIQVRGSTRRMHSGLGGSLHDLADYRAPTSPDDSPRGSGELDNESMAAILRDLEATMRMMEDRPVELAGAKNGLGA